MHNDALKSRSVLDFSTILRYDFKKKQTNKQLSLPSMVSFLKGIYQAQTQISNMVLYSKLTTIRPK